MVYKRNKINFLEFLIYIIILTMHFSCVKASEEELLRVISDDKIVEAVLIRVNGGATTDYSYELYIVTPGIKPKKNTTLFKADHVQDIDIKWGENKLLYIKFKKARIFHFSNFWNSQDVQDYEYNVELKLLPQDTSSLK